MASRQEVRAEETRRAILAAAGQLFAERGYDTVTMREIAKEAGCSHTTIYIYFKDKEALLQHLAMGPLQSLQGEMETILQDPTPSPDDRLIQICRSFIRFCLTNRTMYRIFFMVRSDRVDAATTTLDLNKTRNYLFSLLRRAVQACLPPHVTDEQSLAYARITFFTIHGILATYTDSPEPLEELTLRLAPTFDLAVTVLLAGFKQTAQNGVNPQ